MTTGSMSSLFTTFDHVTDLKLEGYEIYQELTRLVASRTTYPADGDVRVVSMLDQAGRMNVRGRHTNLGYSGYWKGSIFFNRKPQAIVNWRDLFPQEENRYSVAQYQPEAMSEVIRILGSHKSTMALRAKRGWSLRL